MLLIHHDQAKLGQRCEDGGTGAEDDACAAAARRQPAVKALALGHSRVEQGHGRAETRLQALAKLRNQPDLGGEDQDLPASLQHGFQGLQIDLGLAAARHPLQDGGGIAMRRP